MDEDGENEEVRKIKSYNKTEEDSCWLGNMSRIIRTWILMYFFIFQFPTRVFLEKDSKLWKIKITKYFLCCTISAPKATECEFINKYITTRNLTLMNKQNISFTKRKEFQKSLFKNQKHSMKWTIQNRYYSEWRFPKRIVIRSLITYKTLKENKWSVSSKWYHFKVKVCENVQWVHTKTKEMKGRRCF